MKGVELPINVMVIVVLAVIVLIAIAVLFFGVWNPGKDSISLESAKNNACHRLVSMNCNVDNLATIPVSGVGDISNLEDLCEQKYQVSGDDCKVLCGCSGISGGSSEIPAFCENSGDCPIGKTCVSNTCV